MHKIESNAEEKQEYRLEINAHTDIKWKDKGTMIKVHKYTNTQKTTKANSTMATESKRKAD